MTRRLLYFAFLFAVLEIGLQVTFRGWGDRFGIWQPSAFLISEKARLNNESVFDKDLGWVNQHIGPFEERKRPQEFKNTLMVSFGDSYVFGDNVRDHETWQTHLARMTRRNVYNFGVNAYGPDQALIRYETLNPLPKAPWALLGMTGTGLNRAVNFYRKFTFPGTGIPMTKPRFVMDGENLRLIPQPISRKEDLSQLQNPDFVASLCESDSWCKHVLQKHRLTFPALFMLLRPSYWSYLRKISQASEFHPASEWNPWEDSESVAIMKKIWERFAENSKKQGRRPIIVLFPQPDDAKLFPTPPPAVPILRDFCRAHGLTCIEGVTAIAEAAQSEGFHSVYKNDGHLTSRGNEIMARLILKATRTSP